MMTGEAVNAGPHSRGLRLAGNVEAGESAIPDNFIGVA